MAVSAASMRTAAEAFAAEAKGEAKADGELSRCGRRRAHALAEGGACCGPRTRARGERFLCVLRLRFGSPAACGCPRLDTNANAPRPPRREERKQKRAKRKRQHAAKERQKGADRAARAVAAGGDASIAGRKSLSQQLDAAANAGLITRGGGVGGGGGDKRGKRGAGGDAGGGGGPGVKFGRSSAAFGAIQAAKEGGGKKGPGGGGGGERKSSAALKL